MRLPLPSGLRAAILNFFSSPRLANALTLAGIGVGIAADTIQRLIGWPGLVAALVTLVGLIATSLWIRREEIEWQGLLPLSLLIFLGWATVSIFWSQYQWVTLGALAYLVAFTIMGISIALLRDTIQIVRAFGDVFRFVLAVSLIIEILSGVLIDAAIPFLGVEGNLAELGPIQGIMGSRNQIGALALLALITFGTELRTKSISRGLAIGSIIGATFVLLLSRSPVAWGVFIVVGIAVVLLYFLRRVAADRRRFWQLATLVAVVILAGITWLGRTPIISALSANSELTYRLALWRRVWDLIAVHPLEGWGWVATWQSEVQPFPAFVIAGQREPTSALNAYLDVWFQLGLVGLFIFLVLIVLTFTRSWLLAGRENSVVYTWPALMLVALTVTALAESSILVEYGWLIFVVCSVKAARKLSWRRAFARAVPTAE